MNEQQWLESTDPEAMLAFLRETGPLSERKSRLFAVACCRRIWHLLVHEVSREAVEIAERFADELATEDEQYTAYQAADDVWALLPHAFEEQLMAEDPELADAITAAGVPRYAAEEAAEAPVAAVEVAGASFEAYPSAAKAVGWENATGEVADAQAEARERTAQAHLLRDIFGNPFRPLPPLPIAAVGLVAQLARAAYDGRIMPEGRLDNHRLAVLADALEEAGFEDETILSHLRQPDAVHVRGCAVVDFLLNRS